MKIISNKLVKIVNLMLISCFIMGSLFGCSGNKGNEETAHTEVVLPDYDSVEARPFIINSWYAPEPTLEAYQEYKDCGFNYVFLLGHYVGTAGSPRIEQALTICDQLGLKAFVDVSDNLDMIEFVIDSYVKHPSFVGFNYDEPVIYKNNRNNREGIVDIGPKISKMHEKYPEVEFLLNMNPTTSMSFNWGTPSFTYEEYLEAQQEYINSVYADCDADNWISCDDYPLYYNSSARNPYYLKTSWLLNLEYLALAKRDSDIKLVSNFFIQSMPYGTGTRNRLPTYEDIRLQLYTLLAFGYDSVSYFCYCTPTAGGEFQEHQYALVNREGETTEIYESSKRVNTEIKKLANVYMQFNANWLGLCPILGTNNTKKDADYYNKAMDMLKEPLTVARLSGVKSVTSTEDVVIGYMKDNEGNSGFMVVNYNDTTLQAHADVNMTFDGFTKADVYQNGEKTTVLLTDGGLDIKLDVGEGVFVIPHG